MKQIWVGQVVHYVSQGSPIQPDGFQRYKSVCRAAIVTGIEDPPGQAGDGIVGVAVLNPEGLHFQRQISHVNPEHHVPGTWHQLDGCIFTEE